MQKKIQFTVFFATEKSHAQGKKALTRQMTEQEYEHLRGLATPNTLLVREAEEYFHAQRKFHKLQPCKVSHIGIRAIIDL